MHYAIMMGLANELRVFCKRYPVRVSSGDWFVWEWDGGVCTVGIVDGVFILGEGVGPIPTIAIKNAWECDLADPRLVELVRVAVGR